ncbi:Sfi1-domain-containing protein [Lojkania enalia]|uniref:Sfi1-domain-containing protein n=1 Tax=Lojkania enalia TaxID=147567 RepID=A0A9P4KEJ5_9PLEO|nr:Sfi1-domain-containing protein [Didymosphaeria enalia]
MPSPMSSNEDEIEELSNDDIEILYDIVRYAQSMPDLPFRALFQAYDKVLAENGIDRAQDTRYLRFLFRMQDDGVEGEGLVEKFQRLLAEMGIQVQCDPEGEGIEEITKSGLDSQRSGRQNPVGTVLLRRGSFDSFFDRTANNIPGIEPGSEKPKYARRGSRGAMSDTGEARNKRRSRSQTEARAHLLRQPPIRNPINGNNRRTVSNNIQSRPHRSASVSSRGSLRIQRNGHSTTHQFGDYNRDESEHTDSFERSHIQIPGVNAPIPGAVYGSSQPYMPPRTGIQPSNTQMLDDAETFAYHRVLAVARGCVRTWRDRTRTTTQKYEEMGATAYAFDRRILLRASLDSWRISLQNKRQVRETERFFNRLEGRAEKARNLFLLMKAFTHWARSAEDEVQRTSVARRHILRTKYFNAWRDITAVNELKIQHFILAKFLNTWRRRTTVILEDNDVAVALYSENLVFKIYWRWFWTFCDHRAPVWNTIRLKRNIVERWIEIVGLLKEREKWASDKRAHTVIGKTLGVLRQKLASVQSSNTQAQEFRQQALLSSAFSTIRKQVALAPLLFQFKARSDNRILYSSFQAWRRDTQLSCRAGRIDRLRVMRNFWTAWNDRLRVQALAARINDRVIVESLYRWALASRVSLFIRVHDRGLKVSTFTIWAEKARRQRANFKEAERRFIEYKRAQILRSCLRRIEQAIVEKRGQEFVALSVYQPKLKQRVFGKLLEKLGNYQRLNTWASDARFYVLATNAIKCWRDMTQHSRRSRRRETYSQFRRSIKISLVRRMFSIWKAKANRIALQEQQANNLIENRMLNSATLLLNYWHKSTTSFLSLSEQASQLHTTKLATTSFAALHHHLEFLQAIEAQATALRQESIEIVASSSLKKLGWKLWNVRRRDEDALALKHRNFEKHVRAMIRFWFDQTIDRIAQRPGSPTPSSRRRGRDDDNESSGGNRCDEWGEISPEKPGDVTRRLENWTAFDEAGLGLTSPTNLDLSFSLSSQQQQNLPPVPQSSFQAHPPIRTSLPHRPHTQPPPLFSSTRPPPIQELPDLEQVEESAFWTSTPMPRAGYLKTPSKRSVARSKRPELQASPEKRVGFDRTVGVMSAPPTQGGLGVAVATRGGGVSSFERRLREGGFRRNVGRGSVVEGREREK